MTRRAVSVVWAICAVGCGFSLLAGAAGTLHAQEELRPKAPSADEIKFFETHVRPLLADRCYKCHGPRQQENGLRLDSLESMLAGGDSGPALVPGDPQSSLLIEAVRHESFEMPPDGKLPDADVARLVQWIATGAYWPAGGVAATAEGGITEEDRAFWSFQPVQAPPVPALEDGGWSRNAIDRFVLDKLAREGLQPASEADRRTLIRRVYADLVGLPPSPEEVEAFVADDTPTAYEDLVDRLLASPRYGERWGRRWLDLVRYAESNGHGNDQYRPNAWRYRDYVIRAFNEGKPYNRFIQEQLAGDEIAPHDPDALTATGFLRHWIYESNQRLTWLVRDVILTDLTDVTGDVFLGMGLGCARCHDHKFDPILQKDYYRIRSFFAPLLPRDDIPVAAPEQVARFEAQQKTWEAATAEIRRQIAELERPAQEGAVERAFKMYPQEIKDTYRKPASERTPLEQVLTGLVQRQLDDARRGAARRLTGEAKELWDALQKQLAQFAAIQPEPLPYAMVVADIGPTAPVTTLPGRQEEVLPGFLSVFDPALARIEPVATAPSSTGRRTALAGWIASDQNPLTLRVVVNRIWQYHFGRGLVGTSSDFGQLGDRPTHPELLDWLANRFRESGWHIKDMHRLILNSATYRQTSLRPAPPLAQQKDPENHWLWRMNIRRLEAEPIRDAMLAVSGDLDLTMGGASVEAGAPRRTVYTMVVRNTPDPMMRAFDAPDGFISTAQRDESTTPSQALILINGDWSLERAAALARRLEREVPLHDPEAFVTRAYHLCFGRQPEPFELEQTVAFLRELVPRVEIASNSAGPAASATRQALVGLCHVLLNANEFVYID